MYHLPVYVAVAIQHQTLHERFQQVNTNACENYESKAVEELGVEGWNGEYREHREEKNEDNRRSHYHCGEEQTWKSRGHVHTGGDSLLVRVSLEVGVVTSLELLKHPHMAPDGLHGCVRSEGKSHQHRQMQEKLNEAEFQAQEIRHQEPCHFFQ